MLKYPCLREFKKQQAWVFPTQQLFVIRDSPVAELPQNDMIDEFSFRLLRPFIDRLSKLFHTHAG